MSVVIPQELVERLAAAKRVAVLTGAGISAESGIPTFRDALTGLWANYDPQELATPEGFARNPKLVWEWYAERRARIAGVQPNPGHAALAALQQRFAQFTLVTQNIDSLHQRAGSREVVELHGNIARVKCSREETIVSEFPLLIHETYPMAWKQWSKSAGIELPENSKATRLDSMIAIVRACERGLGAALVPVPLADLWFKYGSIVRLFSQQLVTEVSYYLVVREDRARDPAVSLLKDWILRNFREPD